MQQSIMGQGLDLMLYGMGAVCVFLTLLVFLTRLMSWAVNRYIPEPEAPMPAAPVKPAVSAPVDAKIISVIQDAIRQHRGK